MTTLKNAIPLRRTCQQAAQLMLEREDKPLKIVDRLALRLHLWMCTACPRFANQLHVLNHALSDWRNEIKK